MGDVFTELHYKTITLIALCICPEADIFDGCGSRKYTMGGQLLLRVLSCKIEDLPVDMGQLIGGYAVRCQTYAATLKGVLLCAVSPPNSMCKTSVFRAASVSPARLICHLLPADCMYEKAPPASWLSFLQCTMFMLLFINRNWALPVTRGSSSVVMQSVSKHRPPCSKACFHEVGRRQLNPHLRFAILSPLHGQ